MKKKNGVLTDVTEKDLKLLAKNPEKFWKGVTEIGEGAFSLNDEPNSKRAHLVGKLYIPDGVKIIAADAFGGQSELEEVRLPNSLVEIGRGAFMGSGLQSIFVPDKVQTVGAYAFADCKKMSRCDLSVCSADIQESAFNGCTGLEEAHLCAETTTIGDSAFHDCMSLKSIHIPADVRYVGSFAFSGCSSLKEVEFGQDCMASLGAEAFHNCVELESVKNLPSDSRFRLSVFANCPKLKHLDIPSSYTECVNTAFVGSGVEHGIDKVFSETRDEEDLHYSDVTGWFHDHHRGAQFRGKDLSIDGNEVSIVKAEDENRFLHSASKIAQYPELETVPVEELMSSYDDAIQTLEDLPFDLYGEIPAGISKEDVEELKAVEKELAELDGKSETGKHEGSENRAK